jgi:hypothetical protein
MQKAIKEKRKVSGSRQARHPGKDLSTGDRQPIPHQDHKAPEPTIILFDPTDIINNLQPRHYHSVLGTMKNETILQSGNVEKLILDFYDIIGDVFIGYAGEFTEKSDPVDVLMWMIDQYDLKAGDDREDFLWRLEYKSIMSKDDTLGIVQSDPYSDIPITGYGFDARFLMFIKDNDPILHDVWVQILAVMYPKCNFWDTEDYRYALEDLPNQIGDLDMRDPDDRKVIIEYNKCLAMYTTGTAHKYLEEIKQRAETNPIPELRRLCYGLDQSEFHQETLSCADLAMRIRESEYHIYDFLPDNENGYYTELITPFDFMCIMWDVDYERDPVQQIVQDNFHYKFESSAEEFGFAQYYTLTRDNKEKPDRPDFPILMRNFFNRSCDITDKIGKHYESKQPEGSIVFPEPADCCV